MIDPSHPVFAPDHAGDDADHELERFDRGRHRWTVGLALGLVIALLVIGLVQRGSAGTDRGPRAGEVAPDFSLTSFDGQAVRLSAFRGRPVILNFWASWCPPCRSEAPALTRTARATAERVTFIGIDVRDGEEAARQFIDEFDVPYLNAPDVTGEVERLYGGFGIPFTVFIRADGTIARTWLGPLDERRLLAFIDELTT